MQKETAQNKTAQKETAQNETAQKERQKTICGQIEHAEKRCASEKRRCYDYEEVRIANGESAAAIKRERQDYKTDEV